MGDSSMFVYVWTQVEWMEGFSRMLRKIQIDWSFSPKEGEGAINNGKWSALSPLFEGGILIPDWMYNLLYIQPDGIGRMNAFGGRKIWFCLGVNLILGLHFAKPN